MKLEVGLFFLCEDMEIQLNRQEFDGRALDLYQDHLNHCRYHNHRPYPIPQAFQFQFLSGSPILLLCKHKVMVVFGLVDMSAAKGEFLFLYHMSVHKITLTE